MRNNPSFCRAALLAAFVFAAATAGIAYDVIRGDGLIIRWAPGTVTWQVKVGTTRTLDDGSNFASSFNAAIAQWNAVISTVQFNGVIATEGPGGRQNGINEVFFSSDVYGEAWGASTLAITTSFRSGARRTQSDILFNSGRSWDSYRGSLRSAMDFRRVAIHELGHALGLDHPDEAGQTVTAIMNSRVSSGVDAIRQDDIDGAQFLYGTPGTIARPANNDFANAAAVSLVNNAATLTASSLNATKETGEPNHAPNEPGGASIWWRWVATANGSLAVATAGSNFDTLLAAYTGSAVNALTQLAANDDSVTPEQDSSPTRPRTSIVTVPVTAGTTYYFAVDGWEAEWGTVTIAFTLTPTATAPAITSQPQSLTVGIGGTATFGITAVGTPAPTFQWFRNGTAIAGATAASLSLNNVQTGDAGNYTVTASNSAGSVTSSTAVLTVSGTAPSITTQPQSQTVTVGSNVTFSAAASGTPAPTYQWSKGGTAIAGATGASLTLSNVQTADAGNYSVTATNSVGAATSNVASLTVNAVVVPPPVSGGGGGGGGGGSPSLWFALAAAGAAFARAWRRR
jgi:hypothetical protein